MKYRNKRCQHKITKAIGTIVNEMDNFNPPQFGIQWSSGANWGQFKNHYYWNDKTSINILNSGLPLFDDEEKQSLSYIYNFSKRQSLFLLELCDNNLNLLEELFAILNNNLKLNIPSTKDELKLTLNQLTFKPWSN